MERAGAARVLVAGIGNVFAGDDGFGPEVARRLAASPVPDGVRVVDYGIRGLHLAYDLLDPWDALVLVDALPDRGDAGTVELLQIDPDAVRADAGLDAHGMDPAAVLAGLATLGGRLPPRTLLVGCRVAGTADGMGLSPRVAAAVDDALDLLARVLEHELQSGEVV